MSDEGLAQLRDLLRQWLEVLAPLQREDGSWADGPFQGFDSGGLKTTVYLTAALAEAGLEPDRVRRAVPFLSRPALWWIGRSDSKIQGALPAWHVPILYDAFAITTLATITRRASVLWPQGAAEVVGDVRTTLVGSPEAAWRGKLRSLSVALKAGPGSGIPEWSWFSARLLHALRAAREVVPEVVSKEVPEECVETALGELHQFIEQERFQPPIISDAMQNPWWVNTGVALEAWLSWKPPDDACRAAEERLWEGLSQLATVTGGADQLHLLSHALRANRLGSRARERLPHLVRVVLDRVGEPNRSTADLPGVAAGTFNGLPETLNALAGICYG